MYGRLAALQSIDKIFDDNDNVAQINLHMSRDYLGVIHKLEKESKVVSISTKLHHVIIDFLSLNLKRLSSLEFTKVDTY